MKNLDKMVEVGEHLRSAGLEVVVPAPDEPVASRDEKALSTIKREASRRHMQHIRRPETAAILVVNIDRPNARDYVGPNSFAEIGVAFSIDRKVYLLNGMPESYAEELDAWGVQCLHGDIGLLLQALAVRPDVNPAGSAVTAHQALA